MTHKVNLKQQLEAYEQGRFIDSEGNDDATCCNFYDWFCKDSSLKRKADELYRKLKTFLKHYSEIDTEKVYCFFKNNCPMSGRLYDDFRICDIESGNVIYTVTPKCGHRSTDLNERASIWGKSNDFKQPIKTAATFTKLFVK